MPLDAVGGAAQHTHVVNQDKLDLNLLEKSKIIYDEKETTNQYVKLLKNLEIHMLAINQLIDDAEITNHQKLKQWLDDLKEVVYDAEDVRDVIATQTHENEVSYTTPWNPFKRSLHRELDDVLDRMQCLLDQKDVFDLKPSTRPNSTSETLRPPSTSLVEKSCVYGRDVDKECITKLLLSEDKSNDVGVIAIVGMGGIGKTTLAQLLFNHYQINSVFKLKGWVCVAEDFDVITITKKILHNLTSQSYETNDLDQLQTKLKEIISSTKFLIVLDDVWNENYTNWDNLRTPFGFAAQGSKIIITTRSKTVAAVMGAKTHELKPLSDEACWLLFSKHAFENIQSNAYSTFKANVVKKCQGNPLAAKVLGGLLCKKLGCEEWDEILRSNIWDLSDEASDDILPILRLSYHHLPSNLKRCFAFCSLVPKDFDFEREKLVLLWMAENLLHDSKSKRWIDVGYKYLRDLESRSLIQPSTEGELYFSMHDLVNDLAKSISGEFYKNVDLGSSCNVGVKTRHFSYAVTSDDYEDRVRFEGVSEAKHLRTFMPLCRKWTRLPPLLRSEIWPKLNVLRSLTLASAGIGGGIGKLPDSIGNLKLLRYLDLSGNNELNQLPESVASLYKLKVLNLSSCWRLTKLPESLASLYNLEVFNLNGCSSLTKLPESLASLYNLKVLNLSGCSSLTKLPSKMRQLIKLNHLDIRYTFKLEEMPLQIGRLKDLEVLTDFVLGNGSGSSIGELKELNYLRGSLSIIGLQNITHPEDALVANLNGKSYLQQLSVSWLINSGNSEDARIILENLRPHVNLKRLFIRRYSGTRLPDWLGHYSFVNLVYIGVSGFKHCFDLSPLGQLPSLKSLSIKLCDSLVTLVGTEIPVEWPKEIHHHVGHFSALIKLKIFNCPKLELPQHYCVTSIEEFWLECGSCASLRIFPLSLFPKLKRLHLRHMSSLESLEVIDEVNLESLEIKNCPNYAPKAYLSARV